MFFLTQDTVIIQLPRSGGERETLESGPDICNEISALIIFSLCCAVNCLIIHLAMLLSICALIGVLFDCEPNFELTKFVK